MAANEYYSDESRIRARSDAPLPPLPPSAFDPPNESQHSISPITSPFEDRSHRTYSQRSQQSISSNNDYYRGGRDHDPNPFSDDNIPLENHSQKAHPGPYAQDQLRYEPHGMGNFPPQQPRSPRSRRKGIFSGRIAWVTYTFTLIQSIVFLAELIKNGGPLHSSSSFSVVADKCRCPDQNPYRNPPPIQPHGWPLALRSHQHGCSLRPMHACQRRNSKQDDKLALSQLHIHRRQQPR